MCNYLTESYFLSGRRGQQANASVRAAFVHVVGDLLQSISVLVSAIIIFFKVRGVSLSLGVRKVWEVCRAKPLKLSPP